MGVPNKSCMSRKHSVNLSISTGELNLLPNFQKRGEGLSWSQVLNGNCWKRWGWDFSGVVVQFLHKNKLKSEIFNKKKRLSTKMFSSVNLNSEFGVFKKMQWVLMIKKFVYYGASLKNLIFWVDKKKTVDRGHWQKGGLGQFADLREGLAKKGGWYPNACCRKLT